MTKRSFGKVSDAFESGKFKRLEELILNRNGSLSDGISSKNDTDYYANSYGNVFSHGAIRNRVKTLEMSEMSLGEASASALAEELKDEKCSLEVFTLTNVRLECYSLEEWDDDGVGEKNESNADNADNESGKEKDKKREEEKLKRRLR